MKKKFSTMKLQNRFLLILLLALTISATLFELLWLNKWTLVNWTGNFEILQSQIDGFLKCLSCKRCGRILRR